jgi:Flp pilus assembly pilin Flp
MIRLRRSQEGAAAIEYAIIGALIGIGLIGSLIGTRGSLSAIFGTASSAMASSDAGTAAPQRTSTSPRASFWQAKTLSGSPVTQTSGSFQQTVYTYTDGSQVAILRDTTQNPTRVTVAQMSPDHLTFMSTTYSGATQIGRADMSFASPVSFSSTQVTSWATPGPDQYQIPMPVGAAAALTQDRFTANSGFSNGTPTTVTTDNYSNGSWTGKSTGAPTGTYLSQNTTLGQDQQYFSDITP